MFILSDLDENKEIHLCLVEDHLGNISVKVLLIYLQGSRRKACFNFSLFMNPWKF